MKLRDYNFLADENIDAVVVDYLRQNGLIVRHVIEKELRGSNDSELLHLAFSEELIVLTHDSDFGTLAIANQQPFFGIVYLKPGHIQSRFTIDSLSSILDLENLATPFIVTVKNTNGSIKIRVRLF